MTQITKVFLFALILFAPYFFDKSHAAESIVNFRLVCKEQGEDCHKATIKDSKEDIFVKNVPALTLADLKSATPQSYDMPPEAIEAYKSQGYKDENIPKHVYQLLLKFNDPTVLRILTLMNIGQRLAIFIKDDLVTAPNIREPIKGDTMAVSGPSFTEETVQALSDEINKAIDAKK